MTPQVLIAWVLNALVVGAVGWLVLRVLRRAQWFQCPHCKGKAPVSDIRVDLVHCHLCGWTARRVTPYIGKAAASETSVGTPCAWCGKELAADGMLRLMDGKEYCSACVLQESPDLARLAAAFEPLEERNPITTTRYCLVQFALCLGAVVCFFGGFLLLYALLTGDWRGFPGMMAVIAALGCAVALMRAGAATVGYGMLRLHVTVSDGLLTARFGETRSIHCSLEKCQWYLGPLMQESGQQFLGYVRQVVLLVLPGANGQEPTIIPVGFTPQSRALWQAFLKLARVRQRQAHQPSGVHTLTSTVVVFACLPVAFFLSMFLGRAIGDVLATATGDRGLGNAVSLVCFMLGTMTLWLVAVFSLDRRERRQIASTAPSRQRRLKWWGAFLIALLVCGYLGVFIARDATFGPNGQLAGLALSLTWGVLGGSALARHASRMDHSTIAADDGPCDANPR